MRRYLPLAPMEEYLWLDGRPGYPMHFFLRLRLTGPLDHPALEAAAREVLARYRLLGSIVVRRGHRPCWVSVATERLALEWQPRPAGDAYPAAAEIDIERQPGCRMTVVGQGTAHDLILQLHHACCDGRAAVQLAEELLQAYARLLASPGGPPTAAAGNAEAQLRRRGTCGLTVPGLARLIPRQLVGLHGVCQFLTRVPTPLLDTDPPAVLPDRPPEGYPARHGRTLTRQQTDALRRVARARRTSVNSLLLAALFPSLAKWREGRRQALQVEDWLRVSVPMDVRPPAARLPVCNYFSLVFLDRRLPAIDDPACLLAGLHDEMDLIRRNRLEFIFLHSLAAARWMPGGMGKFIRADACYATTMLSNLGRALESSPLPRDEEGRLLAGGLVLNELELLPPLRPRSPAVFGAVTYAGRLNLAVHYDPRELTAPSAAGLLEELAEQVLAATVTA